MENIIIKNNSETPYIPNIEFLYEQGICTIKGESYMEEPHRFYRPMIDWLREYLTHHNSLLFKLELSYYNTATSKLLLNMFELFKENQQKGKKIDIEWHYSADDPDLLAEIEDFEADAEIEIKKVEV